MITVDRLLKDYPQCSREAAECFFDMLEYNGVKLNPLMYYELRIIEGTIENVAKLLNCDSVEELLESNHYYTRFQNTWFVIDEQGMLKE